MSQTMEDRERNLWLASQRYVSGEIDINELEKVERDQSERLREAILTLSKQSVRLGWLSNIHHLLFSR